MRALRPLLLLFLVAAGGGGPFRIVEFPPAARITAVAFDDLDGDGRAEVLVFRGRRLHLHRADARGGFDPTTPQVIDLKPDALFFGTGQVDADGGTREIVLLAPEGLLYHAMENGRLSPEPRLLFAAKTLLTEGPEDAVHALGFLRDLDGDGLPDIVLATEEGLALHYQGRSPSEDATGAPGVWPAEPSRRLPCPVVGSLRTGPVGLAGTIRGRAGIPELHRIDFTADGRPDLVVDDGRRLTVFPSGTDGRPTDRPPETVDLAPLAPDGAEPPPFALADVNGDGRPDFVVSRRAEGRVDIHLGGRTPGIPEVRIRTKGTLLPPELRDVDGDGRPDLVLAHTPGFNLPSALAAKFSGTIGLTTAVHRNTGDALVPFREEPDLVGEARVTVRLALDDTGRIPEDRTLLHVVGGDFDGDGETDLVVREDADELVLVPGRKGGFDFEAEARIAVPDSSDCVRLLPTVRDLDGDGRPDLALLYRSRSGREDRVVLLLTRRE